MKGKPTLILCLFCCIILFAANIGRTQFNPTSFDDIATPNSNRDFVKLKPGKELSLASFLNREYDTLFELQVEDQLVIKRVVFGNGGLAHVRLQQYYAGYKVLGAHYILHTQKGNIIAANGNLVYDLQANTVPTLSEKEAFQIALNHVPASRYAWQDSTYENALKKVLGKEEATFYPKGELVIVSPTLYRRPENYRLAYEFDIYALEPDLDRKRVYIDAEHGHVLLALDQLHACYNTTGIGHTGHFDQFVQITVDSCGQMDFRLRNDIGGGMKVFNARSSFDYPLTVPVDADNVWTEMELRPGVSALWAMEQFYAYFQETFNWESYDGNNGELEIWVNYGEHFNNAFWNGSWVTCGSGDGINYRSFTSLDIVAHEFFHGVIQSTADLLGISEPGALNEGLSDIFGAVVEHFKHPGGGNWQIGEEVDFSGVPIRPLQNPIQYEFPDTYQGTYWIGLDNCNPSPIGNDNCGVHTNCTVLNYWFYLLSEGGIGVNDNNDLYELEGIGIERAAELVFNVVTAYLAPTYGFPEMRQATIQAASDPSLNFSNEELAALYTAWCAVGLGECSSNSTDSITLLAPNGGETFHPDSLVPISWVHTGMVESVNIQFSANAGANWITIAQNVPTSDSNFIWVVPNYNSHNCLIRVLATEDPLVRDVSDALFAIRGCDVLAHFTVNSQIFCTNESLTASNTSLLLEDIEYTWDLDGTIISTDTEGVSYLFDMPGTYILTLTASDGEDCLDSFSREITVMEVPTADFTATTSNMILHGIADDPSGNNYIWEIDEEVYSVSQNPTFTTVLDTSGPYNVCLTVLGNCGNSKECKLIEISEQTNCIGDEENWRTFVFGRHIKDIAFEGDIIWGISDAGVFKLENGVLTIYDPTNSGLTTFALTSITVRDGLKLIGSELGLFQFDGVTWSFIDLNSIWLPSQHITMLHQDSSGHTWVGTINGLAVWRADDSKYFFAESSDSRINTIFLKDSAAYVGTSQGIGVVSNMDVFTFLSNIDFPNNTDISAVLLDDQGRLFASTIFDLLLIDTLTGATVTQNLATTNGYSGGNANALLFDHQGNFIIGSEDSGIYKFRNDTLINHWKIFNSGLISNDVTVIKTNGEQTWAGTKNGLYRFDENEEAAWILNNTDQSGLLTQRVAHIDIAGDQIRIVSAENVLSFQNPDWLVSDCGLDALDIAIDHTGVTWTYAIGHHPEYEGMIHKVNAFGACIDPSIIGIFRPFSTIEYWDGYLWLGTGRNGTLGQGLIKINVETNEPEVINTSNGLLNNLVPDIDRGPSGALFVANRSDTLIQLEPNGEIIYHPLVVEGLPMSPDLYMVEVGNDGDIWLGSQASGNDSYLLKYNNGSTQMVEGIPNDDEINVIKVDIHGNAYIGYEASGLYIIDPVADTIKQFTNLNSPLPGNEVTDIAFSSDGSIWITTNNGIGILKPTSTEVIPSFEFPMGAICAGQNISFVNSTQGATHYRWEVNGNFISNAINLEYQFDEAAEYIITLTAINNEGCESNYSAVLEVYPQADLSEDWIDHISVCDNTVELCAPNSNMASYSWVKNNVEVGTGACLGIVTSGFYTLIVEDHCGNTATNSVLVFLDDECVWPGDANYDNIANIYDLLKIGEAFGYFGPSRIGASVLYIGQPADNWNGASAEGINFKHVDMNGDGIIDLADFFVLEANYGMTHGIPPSDPGLSNSPITLVPEIIQLPTEENNWEMRIAIKVDNDGMPFLDNIYGVAFKIDYFIPGVEFVNPPSIDFSNSDLGILWEEVLSISRHAPFDHIIEGCITRLNHQNQPGTSKLGEATFHIVVDDHLEIFDSLAITIDINATRMVSNDGSVIPVGNTNTNLLLTSADEQQSIQQMIIAPNPTNGLFYIHYESDIPQELEFSIYNLQGQKLWKKQATGLQQRHAVDIQHLPAGVYMLTALTADRQIQLHKIVKQ